MSDEGKVNGFDEVRPFTFHSKLFIRVTIMGMRIGTEMPRLDGATEWFGGTQAHAEMEAKGHPTLVHFWSMSCGMCKDNLPLVAEWRDELKERGLRGSEGHLSRAQR